MAVSAALLLLGADFSFSRVNRRWLDEFDWESACAHARAREREREREETQGGGLIKCKFTSGRCGFSCISVHADIDKEIGREHIYI